MAKTFDELLDLSEFDGQSLMVKYIHHGGDINTYGTKRTSGTERRDSPENVETKPRAFSARRSRLRMSLFRMTLKRSCRG